jgi:hypothetical protein
MGDVESDSPTVKAAPLTYKAEPSGGRVSVRGFRLLLVLTLLNTTLLGASVLGPQLFPFLQARWAQWQASRARAAARQAALAIEQQCLSHSIPADKVVYEEDPDRAASLTSSDPAGYRAIRATGMSGPPAWRPPVMAVLPDYFNGTVYPLLFLHERVTPAGARYVVSVHLLTRHTFGPARDASGRTVSIKLNKRRQVYAEARLAASAGPAPAGVESQQRHAVELILPDSREHELVRFGSDPPVGQASPLNYGNILRFFAGQPDPDDATHFTLHYQVDGRDGVIDGWLKDDGIEMRPREGQWSFDPGGPGWRLPTGADTRPTTQPAPATAPAAAPRRP